MNRATDATAFRPVHDGAPKSDLLAMPLDPRLVALFEGFARAAAAAVVLIGAAVLAGWTFDISALKTVVAGTVSMKANTAVALTLCGASLLLAVPGVPAVQRRAARAAAVFAMAIAAATLVEYATGAQLGIDELLVADDPSPVATSHPGRMSWLTGVLFLLVASGLLLLDRETRRGFRPAQILAVTAFSLASVPLLGYFYELPVMAESSTRIAIHTAAAFALLSLGLLAARPDRGLMALIASSGSGGRLARTMLPVTILLLGILGAIRLSGQRAGLYDTEFGAALFAGAVTVLLSILVWSLALSIERAEAHQKRDAARFRATFEQAAVGVAHVALDGGWLRVNRKLLDILGYSEAELLAKTLQDITHPDDLDADLGYVRQLLAGETQTYSMEKRCIRKDGSPVWINLTASLVRDAKGRPDYFISVVEDVSRRRQAEQELAQANRNFQLISAVNRLLIQAHSPDALLRDACNAAVTVGGYRMAWVGRAENTPGKPVRAVAWAGTGAGEYVTSAGITWADEPHGRGPVGRAFRERTPQLSRHLFSDPVMVPWRELAARYGYASSCALPLRLGDGISGALVLHSAQPEAFDESELALLQQMTADVGFGLAALRTRAERETAEASLRLSEARFRTLVEGLPQLVWTCAPEGPCDYLSPQWLQYTGLPEAPQLGFGWLEQVHPDDREPTVAAWAAAAKAVGEFNVEFRIRRHDGLYRWFKTRALPVRDERGALVKWVGSNTDITDLRAAEAELRSIEWMLSRRAAPAVAPAPQPYGDLTALNTDRTILDAVGKDLLHDIVSDYMDLLETSSAVYEKNGDYAYGIFTSGWCQAMDYASYRGCGVSDAGAALACGRWSCHESCWNVASRKSIEIRGPTDIACAGGIRLHAVPIFAGEEIVGSINFGYGSPPRDESRLVELAEKYGLAVDELRRNASGYRERPAFVVDLAKRRLQGSARLIGEIVQRRRAEEALGELNVGLEQGVAQRTAELASANRELEAFAYSVSHDLRAPLRAMDGFSLALLEDYADKLDAEGRDSLQRIRAASQRMGMLIDDILRLSRAGRATMHLEAVDVSALARAIALALEHETPSRHVRWEIADGLTARADRPLLEIALHNLIENAWKFTGRTPEPVIRVGARASGDAAEYFVADNGAGFDMAHAGRLFGAFQRLHSTEEFPGTGIGLAIVQRIVRRHGGEIRAEARPGEGATFFFTIGNDKVSSHG